MGQIRRIRDYGIVVGELPPGARNAISDVAGVRVGHCTLKDGAVQTGVTAILPHPGNLFRDKVMAASHVINGFGKSAGLVQIDELGAIETPIVLTNTLSVGTAFDALVRYMLGQNADIGLTTGTVNPVICECNDGYLNDIRAANIRAEHVLAALESAGADVVEGSVGAGRGMSCFGLKGGIGTASRRVDLGQATHLGALVLSNMGLMRDLSVASHRIGPEICRRCDPVAPPESGSIIIVLATDAPLCDRQLRRLCRRAVVGLARTGSFIGTGSGEIVLGFSTANRIPHDKRSDFETFSRVHEAHMDLFFRAAAEATEEAILNSMIAAAPVTGRDGHSRRALGEFGDLFGR